MNKNIALKIVGVVLVLALVGVLVFLGFNFFGKRTAGHESVITFSKGNIDLEINAEIKGDYLSIAIKNKTFSYPNEEDNLTWKIGDIAYNSDSELLPITIEYTFENKENNTLALTFPASSWGKSYANTQDNLNVNYRYKIGNGNFSDALEFSKINNAGREIYLLANQTMVFEVTLEVVNNALALPKEINADLNMKFDRIFTLNLHQVEGATYTNPNKKIVEGTDYETYIIAGDTYYLPSEITISNGERVLIQGVDFEYLLYNEDPRLNPNASPVIGTGTEKYAYLKIFSSSFEKSMSVVLDSIEEDEFLVTTNFTNLKLPTNLIAQKEQTYTLIIEGENAGFSAPQQLTEVKIGNNIATINTDYSYSFDSASSTGTLTIFAASVLNNIEVTAVGVAKTFVIDISETNCALTEKSHTESITYNPNIDFVAYVLGNAGYNERPNVTITIGGEVYTDFEYSQEASPNGKYKLIIPGADIVGDVVITASSNIKTYSITYELNNGLLLSANPENYTVETPTFTLNNPERAGFTFAGWTGTGLQNATKTVTINAGSAQDRSYTANWNIITYSITYNNLDNSTLTVPNPVDYTIESETIILNNPEKAGYTFTGWTNSEILTPSLNVTIDSGSIGNKSFTANWTPTVNSISYMLNGGENNLNNPTNYTIEDTPLEFYNPTKTGADFAGWTTNTITIPTKALVIPQGTYGPLHLTAHWTPKEYSVSYDSAGLSSSESVLPNSCVYHTDFTAKLVPAGDSYAMYFKLTSGETVLNSNDYLWNETEQTLTIFANNIENDLKLKIIAVEYWDGYIPNASSSYAFNGGSGEESDPYLLTTPENLAQFASNVNAGTNYNNKHFVMTNDIALNKGNSQTNEWIPIGTKENPFRGVFNGNNFTVKGVYINNETPQTVTASAMFAEASKTTVINKSVDLNQPITESIAHSKYTYTTPQTLNNSAPEVVNSYSRNISVPAASSYGVAMPDDPTETPEENEYNFTGNYGVYIEWYEADYDSSTFYLQDNSIYKFNVSTVCFDNCSDYNEYVYTNNSAYNKQWPSSGMSMYIYAVEDTSSGECFEGFYTYDGWATPFDSVRQYELEWLAYGDILEGEINGGYVYRYEFTANQEVIESDYYEVLTPYIFGLFTAAPPSEYTVSFNANGGSCDTSSMTVQEGDSYGSLPTPERTGYDFAGWYTSASGGTRKYSSDSVWSSHTLYAHWTATKYTISYTLNGGTASNPTEYYITTADFSLAVPTRNYYTFAGWTGTGLSSATKNVTIKKGSTGNRSYTATWTPITYTISYTLNGGELSGQPTSYTYESNAITLPTPTRAGYTFTGWTGSNGSTPSTSVTIAKNSNGNKSYTANWSEITYKISYTLNGGTNNASNPTGYTINSATITLKDPTKKGYTFTGWTGANGTSPTKNVTITAGSTGDKAYTANWTRNNYTISYTLNGGTATNPTSYNVDSNAITLNNPTKIGYTFTGWTGTDLTTQTITVVINKGSIGNRSYEAHFTANTDTPYMVEHYQQTLNNTYEKVDTDNLTGTTDTQTSAVAKTYVGFTNLTFSQENINGDGSTVVEIYYTRNTYNVNYNATENGGSGNVVETIMYEQNVDLSKTATKAGWEFVGWNTDKNAHEAISQLQMGLESITLYAIYKVTYSMSFYQLYQIDPQIHSETIYNKATTITYNSPMLESNAGLSIIGWGESTNSTSAVYESGESITTNKNITLYAVYSYEVEAAFDGNTNTSGNTVSIIKDVFVTANETIMGYSQAASITLPINGFIKQGYHFKEWAKDSIAGTKFNPGNTDTLLADATYYALWLPNEDTYYKVEHWQENIYDSEFTLFDTDDKEGTTDTLTSGEANDYFGFTVTPFNQINIEPDGSAVLKIYYTRNLHCVTFDSFENNGQTETQVIENVKFGRVVQLDKLSERTDWTFVGWNQDASAIVKQTSVTMSDENITVYAIYSKTFTVEYYQLFKTTAEIQTVTIYNKETNKMVNAHEVEVPANFTVVGWANNPENTHAALYSGVNFSVSEDLTYYAVCSYEVTISYDKGSQFATGTMESHSNTAYKTANKTVEAFTTPTKLYLKTNEFERAGYTFNIWAENSVGGTQYVEGAERILSVDTTYFALWTANNNTPYKVHHYKEQLDGTLMLFETDELTGSSDSQVTPEVKHYTGFTSPQTQTVVVKADGSLEVIYNYIRKYYVVTYNAAENGGITAEQTESFLYEQEIDLSKIVEKPTWNHIGWHTDKTSFVGLSSMTMPAENITLYALFSKIYTGSFYHLGSETSEDVAVTIYNSATTGTISAPQLNDLDELEQIGWGMTSTSTSKSYGEGENIILDCDKDFFAIYSYYVIVTYNGNNATSGQMQPDLVKAYKTANKSLEPTIRPATIILKQNQFVNIGYTFSKWAEHNENGELFTPNSTRVITEDIEYFAIWTPNTNTEYTVRHMLQKLDESGYDIYDEETLTGTTNTMSVASEKFINGFYCLYFEQANINADGSTVIEIKYDRVGYKVTYDAQVNGGNEFSELVNVKFESSIDLSITASKTGYEFIGWNTDKDATEALEYLYMSTTDITLYAIFKTELKSYFYQVAETEPQVISATLYNNEQTANIITPALYIFQDHTEKGWAVTGTNVIAYGNSLLSVSEERTYYAVYSYSYVISFNGNGETSGQMSAITKSGHAVANATDSYAVYITKTTLSECEFAKAGYSFVKWAQDNTEGVQYSAGEQLMLYEDTVFYAIWTANKYVVYLDNGDCTTAGTTMVYATYGQQMPEIVLPSKTNYNFTGYYLTKNSDGAKYYNSDGTSAFRWNIANNETTLYAHYEIAVVNLIIEKDNGINVVTGAGAVNCGEIYEIKAVTNPHYTFVCWEIIDGTGAVILEPQSASTMIQIAQSDVTVRAVTEFTKYAVNVTGDSGIESTAGEGNYDINTEVYAEATPLAEYAFMFWSINGLYTLESGEIFNSNITIKVSSDTSLTAYSAKVSNLGLFGYNAGTILNLIVEVVSICGTYDNVAAVAANNSGTIDNCHSAGDISGRIAGGVVAVNTGIVTNSSSEVTITNSREVEGVMQGDIIAKDN